MVKLNSVFGFDVSYPGVGIKVDIIVMKEYLTQMEIGVEAVKDSYVKAEEGNFSGQEHGEMSHIYYIEDNMPRYIRAPFLISIFSLYENSMKRLLKYAQIKEEKESFLENIDAKSLQSKFSKYMKNVLEYNFEFHQKEIRELQEINQLRNCIAHANGNLDATKDKIKELILQLESEGKGVEVINQQLDISHKYLVSSMATITSLLEALMTYMEGKYNCYG